MENGECGEPRGIVKTAHFGRDVSKTMTVRENILHSFSLDKTGPIIGCHVPRQQNRALHLVSH